MKAWKIILGLLLTVVISLPVMADSVKWKKNMLLIYVPQDEYAPQMKNAFAEWQSKLRQKIQFYNSHITKSDTVKEDVNLNDIVVRFERVQGEDAKNEGSTTLVQMGSGAIKHADIVIKIKEPGEAEDANTKANNEKEISIIMQRQVGKALGLADSENIDSVMYNEVGLNQTILQEDVVRFFNQYNIPYYKPLNAK